MEKEIDSKNIITKITSINNTVYYFCNDGKIYNKDFKLLDNTKKENYEIIKKIMSKYEHGKIDIIKDDNKSIEFER